MAVFGRFLFLLKETILAYKDPEYKKKWHRNHPEYNSQYYRENIEKFRENNRKWYRENTKKAKEYSREWKRNHRKQAREWAVQWCKKHREEERERGRKYYRKHIEEERERSRRRYRECPEKDRERHEKWRKEHPVESAERNRRTNRKKLSTVMGRLNAAMRHGIWYSLKGNKSGHWETLVGYTTAQCRRHLESQFEPWMNWDNYGKKPGYWSIDHIKPITSFSFSKSDDLEFKQCWALCNLRPLLHVENIRKKNKCY